MHTYHITYYYLASGMEGIADVRDYGYINAWSSAEAIEKMGLMLYPREKDKTSREWGLQAEPVRRDTSRIKDI